MENGAVTTTIDGVTYSIGRLSPKKGIHVAAKLMPFLGAILPSLRELFRKGDNGESPSSDEFLERAKHALPPVAEALAKMPPEDIDLILDTCLAVVQIRQERGWAPVMVNGTMMFDTLSMKTMLQLAGEVIRENMSDFFPIVPLKESGTRSTITQ